MAKASRRSRGSATIEDVARVAGVSAMTVSRVINAKNNVRETTRAAVLKAIDELNYSPNAAARTLAAGEAIHIGLLYANPSAAYLSQFLVGALEGARRTGAHLVLEPCESEAASEQAETTRAFLQSGLDGIILPPPLSESMAVHSEIAASGMPMVTVAMGLPKEELLNVRIDDFAAAREITTHLLKLGHRRIGFIRGHPSMTASAERYRGFAAAIADAGLAAADAPVEQGYFTYRSGLVAAERLLARDARPTAIFASNDDMAAATVNVAHRANLDVPGDISVVGFDDTAPATTVWPELTTIRQPIAEMAEAAIDLLMSELRNGREGAAERVLQHQLIIRDSSRPPGEAPSKTPIKS
ncbi:MAG TPA: LacI family DNA-binding transcriptional regulator [Sphingomicrobium sp.]|nr:LacI family DNA-binding transcriptional regulator [Sphingomicrobium sp.]